MHYCRYLLIGLLALVITGCGQSVQDTMTLKHPLPKQSEAGDNKTIVILPFANYFFVDDLEATYRRNLLVNENIVDQLVSHGFNLPIQEDVFMYLIDNRVIESLTHEEQHAVVREELVAGGWSDSMRSEVESHLVSSAQRISTANMASSVAATFGLTSQEIVKIGRYFGADYILRGRVVQYEGRSAPIWVPIKRVLLNVDKVPQTVLQLRLWVQNAHTGDIVWTNRVNVRVSSEKFFASYKYNDLFEGAIEKAVYSLINDFASKL